MNLYLGFEANIHSFLTSALYEGECLASRFHRFIPVYESLNLIKQEDAEKKSFIEGKKLLTLTEKKTFHSEFPP
jgi:hypothetical protein